MAKSDTENAQAAYGLWDEISSMRMWLDRAEYIMQDITEDYFGKHDPKSERGSSFILWEYQRYSVKGDIANDYLFKIRDMLDALYEQAERVGLERKKVREGAAKMTPDEMRQALVSLIVGMGDEEAKRLFDTLIKMGLESEKA